MPVACSSVIEPLDQDRFHQLDKQLMGEVFAMHNTMGRFFDEKIYQAEFAERCRGLGIEANREVEIRVIHEDFYKSYFIDLLVGRGCLYELKAAKALNPSHDKQVIQYLLLAGLNHGKLVNFRPSSVGSRFVSSSLGHQDRKNVIIDDRDWLGHETLLDLHLRRLLADWGAFLNAELYRDALLHLTRTPESGIQNVPIVVRGRLAGQQKLCILDPRTGWHLSTIRQHQDAYEVHIHRLIAHTPLTKLHWINLDQRKVTLKTLLS